ncbi:MAG: virulence-associated E family protein [Clostridiales bacterium]|nr:virulence-associated E family protein [Clostridiales bacterium]
MKYDRQITITTAGSRKSLTWLPETLRLSDFYARLSRPRRDELTMAEYLRLKKAQQDERKDVGGYVAGTLAGQRRKAGAVTSRCVITLDLDNLPAGGTEDTVRRIEGLGCGYCISSTRKHTAARPRLRVLLPTDRDMTADEYEPCARYMADKIGMALMDPTTFEVGRLMYWPSVCADGEYIYYAGDKPLLSVDGILAAYQDWRDTRSWPAPVGVAPAAHPGAKQKDPTAKEGLVGAFCRVYDVEAAIATFLPGVYTPCDGDDGRYTYAAGSTTGGAVVYDDGKFLYSHHATDPCGGQLVNAFDLVRIHKFGDQDDEAKAGTPVAGLPSFKAMTALARQDEAVAGLLLEEQWAKTAAAFTPEPAGEETADDGAWRKKLTLNGNSRPDKSLANYRTVLENDPRLKGRIRLNLFSGRIDAAGKLPWVRTGSGTWSDEDTAQLRVYLETFFEKVAKQDLLDAISVTATDQSYHPVRDYLNGLTWDGTPRLDGLFIDYLGAEDSDYTRAVTRKSLTAAVARVMEPGTKYDTMLVLVGSQGRYKSTILSKLGGDWFSDSLRTFEGKDAMETIQGTWLNEVPEMQAMSKSDIDAVKAFLTKTKDYYRAAYGRYTADRPRQCVFFGTTNSKDCLTDPTGGRRFWVVDIDQQTRTKDVWADLDGERDQIWAEAVAQWRRGEPLHLSPAMEDEARKVQEAHRQRHPWEGIIADFLEQPVPVGWPTRDLDKRKMYYGGNAEHGELVPRTRVCAIEIWCEALGKPKGDLNKRVAREINELLEQVPGWNGIGTRQMGPSYGKQRCFERT